MPLSLALVGWVGTGLVLLAYAQPTARRLRLVSQVAGVVLIVFNASIGVWSNVALEVALLVINLVHLRRERLAAAAPRPAVAVPGLSVAASG